MRKLFTILLFHIAIIAYGQDMSVKSFLLAETDLTANTAGTMVYDQNGNLCALIKLESSLEFRFDVGSLGVREVKTVGGETWIYVPFGIRKITISHSQLGVIRDYALPCAIEKGRTYILRLDIKAVNRDYSKKQSLHLQVKPTNASVEIDGWELTLDNDGRLSQTVPVGFHDIKVSAPNYHTKEFNFRDTLKDVSLSINLKPKFGWLNISGSGDEQLYIDGELTPYTPNRLREIDSGIYTLRLNKPLHTPYETTIEVRDSLVVDIAPDFIPNFREVEISFKKFSSAEIWINGKKAGTSYWKGKLEYGQYEIKGVEANCATSVLNLEIQPDSPQVITLDTPTPIYGDLVVNCNIPYSTVYIDGDEVGKSGETLNVQIGQRKLSVAKDGYQKAEHTIEIKETEINRVNISLADISVGTLNITSSPRGARIKIDGTNYGRTPRFINDISTGTHRVKATLDGYKKAAKTINVFGGRNTDVDFTLKKKPQKIKTTSSTSYKSSSYSDNLYDSFCKFGASVIAGYDSWSEVGMIGIGTTCRARYFQFGAELLSLPEEEVTIIGIPIAANLNILPKRFEWSPYIGIGYYPCMLSYSYELDYEFEFDVEWYSFWFVQTGLDFRHWDINCRYLFDGDYVTLTFGVSYYF